MNLHAIFLFTLNEEIFHAVDFVSVSFILMGISEVLFIRVRNFGGYICQICINL